jgi:hypothetical protein
MKIGKLKTQNSKRETGVPAERVSAVRLFFFPMNNGSDGTLGLSAVMFVQVSLVHSAEKSNIYLNSTPLFLHGSVYFADTFPRFLFDRTNTNMNPTVIIAVPLITYVLSNCA